MTLEVRQTRLARADLVDILAYIAERNPTAAQHLKDRFAEAFARLADVPLLGPARPVLLEGIRIYPIGSYIVFYQLRGDVVEIVRVLHAARDIRTLLEEGGDPHT